MAKNPSGCEAMFWSSLALLFPFASVKRLVDIDYEGEIESNIYFARQTPAQLETWKANYEKDVRKRLSILRRVLLSAFAWLALGVLAAFALRWWHDGSYSPAAKLWLGVLSVFCFAWATLARLGREGQSLGGRTAVEHLDMRILWLLYWLGTFLGTLALI